MATELEGTEVRGIFSGDERVTVPRGYAALIEEDDKVALYLPSRVGSIDEAELSEIGRFFAGCMIAYGTRPDLVEILSSLSKFSEDQPKN